MKPLTIVLLGAAAVAAWFVLRPKATPAPAQSDLSWLDTAPTSTDADHAARAAKCNAANGYYDPSSGTCWTGF